MAIAFCCPYYRSNNSFKSTCYCEMCKLYFTNPELYEYYIKKYCANHPGWQDCTLSKAITETYEEQGRD